MTPAGCGGLGSELQDHTGVHGARGLHPGEACAQVLLGSCSVRTVLLRRMVCFGLRNCTGWENNEGSFQNKILERKVPD